MTKLASGLTLHDEPPPFRVTEEGGICIGDSRITLDLVVEQYENGMTPEDIVRAYDTLDLADVHATIAYYLRHRVEVQGYLNRRRTEAESLRTKIESQRTPILRSELLARLKAGAVEKSDAPTSN
jgi:uncharacterized protein (DUF433 family)